MGRWTEAVGRSGGRAIGRQPAIGNRDGTEGDPLVASAQKSFCSSRAQKTSADVFSGEEDLERLERSSGNDDDGR